jgi:uncharacterized protein YunC (DUF1805 family)
MEKSIIELDNGDAVGYNIDLYNAPLLIIKAKKGYVMCGYLNMDVANKLGDIAGKVSGVKNFDDVLNGTIIEISDKARKKGFKTGMAGRQFLNKLIDI